MSKHKKDIDEKDATLTLIYGLTTGIVIFLISVMSIVYLVNKELDKEKNIVLEFHDRSIAESIILVSSLYRLEVLTQNKLNWNSPENKAVLVAELALILRQNVKLFNIQKNYAHDRYYETMSRLSEQLNRINNNFLSSDNQLSSDAFNKQFINPAIHSAEQLHLLHQHARELKISKLSGGAIRGERFIYFISLVSVFIGVPVILLILKRVKKNILLQRATISQLQTAHKNLERLAFYDPLTGLANRRLFKDHLNQAINATDRSEHIYGIFYIDIDNFKRINDSLGHDTGDKLLKEVAIRLTETVRTTDTVSRISGDEFNLLLDTIDSEVRAAQLATKILKKLSQPIHIEHHEIFVTASIGITIFPNDSRDAQTLLKFADLAMYQAKQKGKHAYQFYNESLNKIAIENLKIETKLRKAISNEQFELFYQPQFSLISNRIVGYEALIRWFDPDEGMIPPDRFIPIAESTGLIDEIGQWVIERACRDIPAIISASDEKIKVAINISARQMRNPSLLPFLQQALKRNNASPMNIELEVTESILMEDIHESQTLLKCFQQLGINVAIDDFGTGYSCFSYLNQLSVDTLKIDRSFIQHITENKNEREIASAIIAMAHNLNLKVIAEGVETEAQLNLLRQQGCDICQGYFFSKPHPLSQLLEPAKAANQ